MSDIRDMEWDPMPKNVQWEEGDMLADWPQQQVEDVGDQRMDVPTTDLKPEDKKRK